MTLFIKIDSCPIFKLRCLCGFRSVMMRNGISDGDCGVCVILFRGWIQALIFRQKYITQYKIVGKVSCITLQPTFSPDWKMATQFIVLIFPPCTAVDPSCRAPTGTRSDLGIGIGNTHTHTHIHYTHTCVAVSQNRSANGCVENGDFWDLRSRRTRIGTHTDKHRESLSAQSNILSLIVAFMLVFFQLFLTSLLFIGNKIRDGTVSLFSFFNSFGFPRGQCGLLHNHHFHRVKTPPSMSG